MKMASFCPNVVEIPSNTPNPAYNLILGVKSLVKLDTILDFKNKKVSIDGITAPMRPKSVLNKKELQLQFKRDIEPTSTSDG